MLGALKNKRGSMVSLFIGATVGERLTEALLPKKIKIIGNFCVGPSMFTAFGVTIGILIVCLILRLTVIKRLKTVPKKPQMMLEMIVGMFDKVAKETSNGYAGFMGPYIFAAAAFISISTLVELLGIRPALGDINACIALGISSFIIIHFFGAKKLGIPRRAKRLLNPINIITDVAVPISLSFRLFGSIVSGMLIMELIYSYIHLSFVLPAAISLITTIFHAVVQAYIFITLSSLFVSEAMETN